MKRPSFEGLPKALSWFSMGNRSLRTISLKRTNSIGGGIIRCTKTGEEVVSNLEQCNKLEVGLIMISYLKWENPNI